MADPVVHEIPVFLTKEAGRNLYLLQFPLRPGHMPYNGDNVLEAKIKEKQSKVELSVAIETRGQHYSRSKGEQYARGAETEGGVSYFSSGVMDKQTMVSDGHKCQDTSRYVIGVFKDDELHLTPLHDIIQLRPSLCHLEFGDTLSQRSFYVGGSASDGDTTATESESEEAKPVTVRFARPNMKAKVKTQVDPEEPWQPLTYHSLESAESTEERTLLFSADEDQSHIFSSTALKYLDMICPVETIQESESPLESTGFLSLTQLKMLPLEKQVTELMKKAMILPFDRVCTLLGRGKNERGAILDDLQKCALLVQGCWVVHSALLLSKESAHLRNARDFILWCFTQNHLLTRKDLAATLKITSAQLRDILHPIAVLRTGGGWEFRHAPDTEFMNKYPQIVLTQHDWWQKKHSELAVLYSIGLSPEASKTCNVSTNSQEGSVVTAHEVIKSATSKAKQRIESQLDATPVRPHPLQPSQLDHKLPHRLTQECRDALRKFCIKTLGRGVASLSDIKDRLLIHQSSAQEDDPLCGHGISNEMIDMALNEVDAIEVGQPHSKRLFALVNVGDNTDTYRSILLMLFQTVRSVRRKQVVDKISQQCGHQCDNKLLTTVLKDLCNSRGSQWYLKGI